MCVGIHLAPVEMACATPKIIARVTFLQVKVMENKVARAVQAALQSIIVGQILLFRFTTASKALCCQDNALPPRLRSHEI